MRLLAIVPSIYDSQPSQRYRIEQWEPMLRERGVEITYQRFADAELNEVLYQPGRVARKAQLIARALARRARELADVPSFDAVYLLRAATLLGPPIFERRLARSGVPVIFDFDDAIWLNHPSPANGYFIYLKFPGKTAVICRLATHVMVGNDYLASFARAYNPRVSVVPTTIDTRRYAITARAANEVPVIGWTGSYSTVSHLQTVAPALRRLAARTRFRLRVIGAPDARLEGFEGIEVEMLPWRSATEVDDLRALDVGVMPLPDNAWTRGKCGTKALQYMGLAIPAVCSPVGVGSVIIRDGENGLLASTEDEWVEKLRLLLGSPQLRARLGHAGRATVEAEYSADMQVPRVFEIIESVARAKAGAKKSQRDSLSCSR